MRGWLGGIATAFLCLSGMAGAGPLNCGPSPTAKCLATEIFALAKTLPADDGFRQQVAFAEQELVPGDLTVALEYIVSDNPDPLPWEQIDWMARAGRFDPAIKRAEQRVSPVERLGGLLAVAERLLDKNDAVRAQKIVEEVERQLPSLAGNNDNDAKSLPESAGEIRARLGQADRAARLVTGSGTTSVSNLLAIAGKYPAAASLREEAWREAKRVNELSGWQSLMEDAIRRGDPAEISRTAQRIGEVIDGASDRNLSGWATPLAQVLLTAGFPDLSARLVSPWPQWLNGKEATVQSGLVDPVILKANIVDRVIPVLAGLARDRDVEMAVGAVSEPAIRSQCLSKAATEYFRLGRRDLAEKLDTEALVLAVSSPTRESKLRGYHDGALHNLALVRADRGDIDGALIATAKLLDEAKVRQVTVCLVQRAIDAGHGPVAAPAIETLEQRATAAQDVPSLLVAANAWYVAGEKDKA